MRIIARLVLGIIVGVPAGNLAGCLIAALVGVLLMASEIIQSTSGGLDTALGLIAMGMVFASLSLPITTAPSVFGGTLSVFSGSRNGLLVVIATFFGLIIGLLSLSAYLFVEGNIYPDRLEIIGKLTAGGVSGMVSALVAVQTVQMVEKRQAIR